MDAQPPRMAWGRVLSAAILQAVALTVGSVGYGYHRDELYFRMLPHAWGYLGQPPLTPLLARATTVLADEPWAERLPATLAASASVVLIGLLTRQLGGGRGAQTLSAFGYAFAALPLMLGHLLLTSTLDLPLLLLFVLALVRALDGRPSWWIWAGAVAGFTASNRLLVVIVAAGLALGIALLGPRRVFATRWPWLGGLVAAVVALPQIGYQATHDWPQLAMGRALSANNSVDVRSSLPLLLLVMLGPPLVLVWITGIGWLLRPRQRGRFGFLVVGFVVVLVFTYASGAQPHYPVHLLSVMYAAGCVSVARWLTAHAIWRRVAVVLVATNAAVSLTIALPLIPVGTVGSTPVAGVADLLPDQVGWPTYVAQVATAYASATTEGPLSIVTSNYGEAGAIARYGPARGLPKPFSAHNALYDLGGPRSGDALVVGGQVDLARTLFRSCQVVGHLSNGEGVDSEEEGQPIAVCRGPVQPWTVLWPRLRHLD